MKSKQSAEKSVADIGEEEQHYRENTIVILPVYLPVGFGLAGWEARLQTFRRHTAVLKAWLPYHVRT